jgi:flagellar biosynthesis/type III secretory pathway protein FliH
VSPDDYEKLDIVYRTKEEVRTMLVATLEQEREKVYQQGKDAGLAEGRKETQRQTISQLLQFRFELTDADLHSFMQQVANLQELQPLDELVNVLLNKAATLADFTAALTIYLPAHQTQ